MSKRRVRKRKKIDVMFDWSPVDGSERRIEMPLSVSGRALTNVGRRLVPVRQREHPTLGVFSAGARGTRERGLYFFWTAVLKRPHVNGHRSVTARARALLPPGERFERMAREMRTARRAAARRGNQFTWEQVLRQGAAISYIRPANLREVTHWMATHADDYKHLTWLQVGPPVPKGSNVGWDRGRQASKEEVIVAEGMEVEAIGGEGIEVKGPDFPILDALRRGWAWCVQRWKTRRARMAREAVGQPVAEA